MNSGWRNILLSNKASAETIVVEPAHIGHNQSPKNMESSQNAESLSMHIDRSVADVRNEGYAQGRNKLTDSQMVLQSSIDEFASNLNRESYNSEDRWKFQLTTTPSQIREHWHNKYDFVMAGIGFCVGLGNLWRFPARVYTNGGAAFLITYAFLHFSIGLPMLLLEATVGQYSGKGPIQMWAINRAAAGIGFVCVLISALDSISYNKVIAWVLFYMFASMQTPLPWTQCEEKWLEKKCYHPQSDISFPLCNKTKFNISNINVTFSGCKCSGNSDDDFDTNDNCFVRGTTYENLTKISAFGNCSNMLLCTNKTESPSKLYFDKYIKMKDDANATYDIFHIGKPRWYMCYCLLLSWIVVVFSLMKGISTASRVMYFTVIFPYVILICLFVNVVTLDGAVDGMQQYIIPEWIKLLDIQVWLESGLQITYSLSFATGGLVMVSSYNHYHQNVYRDAIIIVMFDFMTSFFAGLVVYANIGVLTLQTGQSSYDTDAVNLTFIVLADAISRMEWPTFWAVNFFMMMFAMAIDSQFFLAEIVLTAIKDQFPRARKHTLSLTIVYCTIAFLCGLPLITPGGPYLSNTTTRYYYYAHFLIMILFVVVLVWGYGGNRLLNDLTDMLGFEPWPRWYWLICWMFIVPIWVIFVGSNQLAKGLNFKYFDKTDMETSSIVTAVSLFILWLSPVPVWFTYVVYKADGTRFLVKLHNALRPTTEWLPQVTSRTILVGSDINVRGSTEWPSKVSFDYTH